MRRRCFPPFRADGAARVPRGCAWPRYRPGYWKRPCGPLGENGHRSVCDETHAHAIPGKRLRRADRLAKTGTEAFAMKPTRTRFQVSGFLFLLAAVTYLDRVCISTLAPEISRDLHLSKLEMSFVFSAFAVAYAGFEILSAW